jgi:hypothetical protein
MSTISINKLSVLTGKDRRTISKRLATLSPNASGEYLASEALRLIYNPDELNPTQERARLDAARREMLEIQKSVAEGELVHIDKVTSVWESIVSNVRSKLLNLPPRLAVAVTGSKTIHEAERAAKDLIYEALTELSSGDAHGYK